ncbi:MAG: hypothetical protein Q7R78_00485 [bacterium]|nr:hypothetical protein [bacterium]
MENLNDIELGGIESNKFEIVKDDPIAIFLEKIDKERSEEDKEKESGKDTTSSRKIDISYLSPAEKAESMWALFQNLKGQVSRRKKVVGENGLERFNKEIILLKSLYEDAETKELYQVENARHLKEDEEINGNYDKYEALKKRFEDTNKAVTSSLKNIFRERGAEQISEFDLLLLASNRRNLTQIKTEIEFLIDEDPKLGALAEYETLKRYSEQLKEEKFIWSSSRLEALERIENAALSGKPVLVSGESGTGKTRLVEQVALKLTGEANSQTPGKDVRFEKIIAKPDLLPSSEGGTPYYKYAELGMAVTGKTSTLEDSPKNEGLILADDEFNLRPSSEQTEMMARIATWTPGKKIRMPVTNKEEIVAPNFLFCAMVNLASERYERKKIPPEVARKFAKVDLDYNEQAPDNPEIYEMLLCALMDENGRIRGANAELSPNYEYKEEKDTVTLETGQKISRNVRVRQLKDFEEKEVEKGGKKEKINEPVGGFLWKFANVLNQINLSFSHNETVLKHKREAQYSKDLIIDIGTTLGWMNEYTRMRGEVSIESFVIGKIHEEFLDTDVYTSEDKQLLKDFFKYYGIDVDKKLEDYEKVEFKVMTPNDIGLLSPRVKYREVLKQDPLITEGMFISPEGEPIKYLIKSFESGGQKILPGKIIKNGKGEVLEFMGISKENGGPIFRPFVNTEKDTNRKKRRKSKVESFDVTPEEMKVKYEPFLKKTFEIWYDAEKAKVEQVPIITKPADLDYEAKKSDIDTTKFGQYTVNPDTQNLDFENARLFSLPDDEQKKLEGKTLAEVGEYLKTTYGDRYHIPGIEYWQYILDNPSKVPPSFDKSKYYFNFGSLVRNSGGRWDVPYAYWDGSKWDRNGLWLSGTWNSNGRVLLLEK